MTAPVRIGIVGLGRLGKRHAENLAQRVPGAQLVAAASPVSAEREWAAAALGVRTYDSLEQLLKHPELDAVWLVTPTSLHAEQIGHVLASGRHVFCEKPLALELDACDRVLADAARCPDQVAMIGFMRRFDPAYAAARQSIAAGELGTVFRIHCDSHDPVDPGGFFVKFAPTSGGIFLDCCIHDIDLVRWMLDGARPVSVSAIGSRVMYPDLASCNDVDTACAQVEFEGGIVASFHVSRTSHRGYEAAMSITGARGAMSIGRGLSAMPLVTEVAGCSQSRGQADFFARFNEAFLVEAQAFVHAVQHRAPSPLTLHDAREATRIAVAMREALVSRRTVSLLEA